MNLAYIVLSVGIVLLAVVKLTLDKIESIRYRQNLKFDKLARKARLARKAQEERLANIESQLIMCNAISNRYKVPNFRIWDLQKFLKTNTLLQ